MKQSLKITLSIAIIGLFAMQCTSSKKDTNLFTISGTVYGDTTKQLILYYTGANDKDFADTITINNGAFKFKGSLSTPQKVVLVGNVKSPSFDNPNIARFYLGNNDHVVLDLIEDQFNKTEVLGSTLQDEYVKLNKITEPIRKMVNLIAENQRELKIEREKTKNDTIIKKRLITLNNRIIKLLDSISTIEMNYAWNHSNSFLSPDLVSHYSEQISRDSLMMHYTNFSPMVKKSFEAKSIKELLDLKVVKLSLGEKAPSFNSKDPNGNPISLEQFKGKYVLLDFWAGWCGPCKEKHPELKRLYKTYHAKGLEVIGVSFDRNEKLWRENIIKENLVWHHVFNGLGNNKQDAIGWNYSHEGFPAYYLIDKEGILIGFYLNADGEFNDINVLEDKLKELVH